MSFCDDCGRGYVTTCPTCDHEVEHTQRAPWHFWVVVAGAAGYLLWRAIEGVARLVGWLFG